MSQEMKGLKDLYVDQLKDIYWAENKLINVLPKMKEKATSSKLADAITEHLSETEGQAKRLENIFSSLGMKAEGKECEAMIGIIKEGEEIMNNTESGTVMDAGIIAAAQKVEHYEIASYGTLSHFAQILNDEEAASLLNETLDEEKRTDKKLTEIALSTNIQAAEETENIDAD